jgi:hypothetical protein
MTERIVVAGVPANGEESGPRDVEPKPEQCQ